MSNKYKIYLKITMIIINKSQEKNYVGNIYICSKSEDYISFISKTFHFSFIIFLFSFESNLTIKLLKLLFCSL